MMVNKFKGTFRAKEVNWRKLQTEKEEQTGNWNVSKDRPTLIYLFIYLFSVHSPLFFILMGLVVIHHVY